MQKLTRWLYAIAILIFSALLVAFAYDMEQGTSNELFSTQGARQEMLMWVADVLGFQGSMVVAILATSAALYYAIRQHITKQLKS
ncbi:MAG: hypothetical protein EOO13_10690 [Chitinophagaceae bacterium]|nr:hypothetical protein [Flavisolibacter longurius]RYY69030.1 MAG: hypothetical protein EOO13_10690 [Chitinophagaceae bacterium]